MLPGWQRRLRQSHRLRGGASDHLWQTVSTSASSCSHHRRRQRGSVVLMVPPPRSLPPMTCSAESGGRRKKVLGRFFRASSHWLLRPLHFRKPRTLTASPAGSYYVNFTNSRATTLASRAKRRCPEGQAGRINPSRVQGSLRRVVARRACYSVGDSHWVPPRPSRRRSLARRPSCGCQNHRGGAATACVAVVCRSCCRRKSFSLR